MEAAKVNKDLKSDVVPEVHLHATHERVLDVVSIGNLKAHAAGPEAAGASLRQDSSESREDGMVGGTGAKERKELANKGETTGREL
jgi:uncharacterized protein